MHVDRDKANEFKNQMFKVIRLDGMVLIIPMDWVEELRSVPEHHLSLRHLQIYVSIYLGLFPGIRDITVVLFNPEPPWQGYNYGYSTQE